MGKSFKETARVEGIHRRAAVRASLASLGPLGCFFCRTAFAGGASPRRSASSAPVALSVTHGQISARCWARMQLLEFFKHAAQANRHRKKHRENGTPRGPREVKEARTAAYFQHTLSLWKNIPPSLHLSSVFMWCPHSTQTLLQ